MATVFPITIIKTLRARHRSEPPSPGRSCADRRHRATRGFRTIGPTAARGLARGELVILMLTGGTFIATATVTTPRFLSALPSGSDDTANEIVLDGEKMRMIQRLEFVLGAAESTLHVATRADGEFADDGMIECLVLKLPLGSHQAEPPPGQVYQEQLLVFNYSEFLHSLTVYSLAGNETESSDSHQSTSAFQPVVAVRSVRQPDFVSRFASLKGVTGRVVATDIRGIRVVSEAADHSSRPDQAASAGWIELTWLDDMADSSVRVILGTPLPPLQQ